MTLLHYINLKFQVIIVERAYYLINDSCNIFGSLENSNEHDIFGCFVVRGVHSISYALNQMS